MKMSEQDFAEKEDLLCNYICEMFGDEVWNKLCDKEFPNEFEDACYEAGVISFEEEEGE